MIGRGVGEKGRERRGKKGRRGVEREKGKNVLPYCQKAASTVEFFLVEHLQNSCTISDHYCPGAPVFRSREIQLLSCLLSHLYEMQAKNKPCPKPLKVNKGEQKSG